VRQRATSASPSAMSARVRSRRNGENEEAIDAFQWQGL
jgi:hypothetical protein